MQFESRYAAYQVVIRQPIMDYSLGYERLVRASLVADFSGPMGEEMLGEDGQKYADIRGGLFDSELAQIENGWTDDERELVEQRLLEISSTPRMEGHDDFWLHEAPRAPLPWPTYEETAPKQVVLLAKQLGLVEPALAYERRREAGPRDEIIGELEAAMADVREQEALKAEV